MYGFALRDGWEDPLWRDDAQMKGNNRPEMSGRKSAEDCTLCEGFISGKDVDSWLRRVTGLAVSKDGPEINLHQRGVI